MFGAIPGLIFGLVVAAIAFGVVEWRWPGRRGQKRLRRGLLTDLGWYAFTPTLGKAFTGIVVAVSVIALARIFGAGITAETLRAQTVRDTAISHQPLALQLIEFLLLADLAGYWQHRAFHRVGRLWRFHAVHHSSTDVDWLSSVRVHPLNDALASTAVATPLLLLGFSPAALAAYLPFLTLYAVMLHANVSWSFGPLRNVISSPAFHRWHHSAEAEALDKNFAGLLPAVDWIFGTLYFPKDKLATVFGVNGEQLPASFLGQLAYPFKRSKPLSEAAS
ncbi:MAG TPA: sterol desaturase family protein [Dehalococcoidia bacterium]|nr:sterol desaturase family protein [Dehalococcoidia bacterium]